jgi:hypothetical protein
VKNEDNPDASAGFDKEITNSSSAALIDERFPGPGPSLVGFVYFSKQAESHKGLCHGGSMCALMDDAIGRCSVGVLYIIIPLFLSLINAQITDVSHIFYLSSLKKAGWGFVILGLFRSGRALQFKSTRL